MFQARGHHQSFWSFLSEDMKANFNQHLTKMILNQFFKMNQEMLTKHPNLVKFCDHTYHQHSAHKFSAGLKFKDIIALFL